MAVEIGTLSPAEKPEYSLKPDFHLQFVKCAKPVAIFDLLLWEECKKKGQAPPLPPDGRIELESN